MNIEDKIIEEQKLAIINYKGSVEDMGILFGKLTSWAELNKVEIVGLPFAMYYTTPGSVKPDEMVYDVGFPVANNTELIEKQEINVVELLEHRVLSIIHIGSYATLSDSYKKMVDYSIENNYDIIGSPKEIYFNNPYEVSENELKTEIQFPVIKM